MSACKRSLIFGLCLFAVYFGAIALNLACGPEPDPYDYYISFFHNTVQQNAAHKPFYYNGYLFLNDEQEPADEHAINAREWAVYMSNEGVKASDVYKVFYGMDGNADNFYFHNLLNLKHHLADSLKNNTFMKALGSKKYNNSALVYCSIVKNVQPIISTNLVWDPEKKDPHAMTDAATRYLQKADDATDRFLKLRYYYQSQRLFHYAGQYDKASQVYDQHIAAFQSGSHVKGWAMALKAGELRWLGDTIKSAYVFSKVFAQYPERRIQAYRNYLFMHTRMADVLKLARNKQEKASIYAINGFNTPGIGLGPMKQVYSVNPSSNLMEVMLLREINKIEDSYLSPKLTNSKYYGGLGYYTASQPDSARRAMIKYIPVLKAYCNQVAAQRKCARPALFRLASAYLSWIEHDARGGLATLDSLHGIKLSRTLNDQQQMINLLLLSQSISRLDTAGENRLLPSLQWLAQKVRQERALKIDTTQYWSSSNYAVRPYSASSRDYFARVLAPIYLRQHDTTRAALCILHSEYTMSPVNRYNTDVENDIYAFWQTSLRSKHIRQIIGWQQQPDLSPYMSVLAKDLQGLPRGSYNSMLGMAYLREHKYALAVAALKKVPIKDLPVADIWAYDDSVHHSNPFMGQLRDYPRAYSKGKAWNQLDYAKAMAALERKIKQHPATPGNYYRMANGLYNVTYYGNSWCFTAYDRTSAEYERKPTFYYDGDYLQARTAESYYLKARALSNNAEFKARCTFMAAKCKQKQLTFPASNDFWMYGSNTSLGRKLEKDYRRREVQYDKDLRNNPYFAELKKHYSKTHLFTAAASECSYLSDFLSRQPIKKPLKYKVVVVDGE